MYIYKSINNFVRTLRDDLFWSGARILNTLKMYVKSTSPNKDDDRGESQIPVMVIL